MLVVEPNQPPDPETAIQGERPAPNPEVGIQADRPASPARGPEMPAFLKRLRQLLQLHAEVNAPRADPPMWGLVQILGVVLAGAIAFGTYRGMKEDNVREDVAGACFVIVFFIMLLMPDALLRLNRRLKVLAG